MRRCVVSCLFVLFALTAVRVHAQEAEGETPAANAHTYENTRWSMIQPDGDFELGCATGYMTFQLRGNGYFIFNNRVSGAWTVDQSGNVRFRTRQGLTFLLTVGQEQMQVIQNLAALRLRRQNLFQRCSE